MFAVLLSVSLNFQINHDAESTTSKMGIFALQLSTGSQRKKRKGGGGREKSD